MENLRLVQLAMVGVLVEKRHVRFHHLASHSCTEQMAWWAAGCGVRRALICKLCCISSSVTRGCCQYNTLISCETRRRLLDLQLLMLTLNLALRSHRGGGGGFTTVLVLVKCLQSSRIQARGGLISSWDPAVWDSRVQKASLDSSGLLYSVM